MSLAVDGVIAAPKDQGGLSPVPDDLALKRLKLEWLARAGCHVMGRTTYEQMAAHWPHSEDPLRRLDETGYRRSSSRAR
jgi:dihydrofolate reductase